MSNAEKYIFDIILRRRSTRNFNQHIKIDKSQINKIIKSGIAAPSAANIDNISYVVIDNLPDIEKLGCIRWVWPYGRQYKFKNKFKSGVIGRASLAIIVLSDDTYLENVNINEREIWSSVSIENAAASIQNMLLMSTSLKLGSCYISANQKMLGTRLLKESYIDFVKKYEVPDHYVLRGIVIVGHPKKKDEKGYPSGEIKHGKNLLPVKNKTKNIKNYLINKNLL